MKGTERLILSVRQFKHVRLTMVPLKDLFNQVLIRVIQFLNLEINVSREKKCKKNIGLLL